MGGFSAWGSALGGLAGGLSSLGLGMLGSAFDWGLGNKSADRQKSAIRHLRRREYQDMVFSMKEAGLNPMLATGATPGHSAPMMAQAGNANAALGAGMGTGLAAVEQPSKIDVNTASAGERRASESLHRKTMESIDVGNQRQIAEMHRIRGELAAIAQQIRESGSRIDVNRAQAGLHSAKTGEAAAVESNIRAGLPGAQETQGRSLIHNPIGYGAHVLREGALGTAKGIDFLGGKAKENIGAGFGKGITAAKELWNWLQEDLERQKEKR